MTCIHHATAALFSSFGPSLGSCICLNAACCSSQCQRHHWGLSLKMTCPCCLLPDALCCYQSQSSLHMSWQGCFYSFLRTVHQHCPSWWRCLLHCSNLRHRNHMALLCCMSRSSLQLTVLLAARSAAACRWPLYGLGWVKRERNPRRPPRPQGS